MICCLQQQETTTTKWNWAKKGIFLNWKFLFKVKIFWKQAITLFDYRSRETFSLQHYKDRAHKIKFSGPRNSIMRIENAENEDSGMYTCSVFNAFGKEMFRNFYVPPTSSKWKSHTVLDLKFFEYMFHLYLSTLT